MTGTFNERAVHFGKSASLMGILSRPSSEIRAGAPAVVLLNTGIAHRVGHHRMYVTLARQLAAVGYLVFRFDFSGIGDSAPRTGTLSPVDAHRADVCEALDWLTASHDVSKVILVGLCAGAEIALRCGHSDQRVAGLVLLDPEIPPTPRFYANYTRRRLMNLGSWWSFVRGRGLIWESLVARTRSVIGAAPSRSENAGDPELYRELEHLYLKSFERKLSALIVVTGKALEGRYREQLFDAFPNVPLKGWVSLEYYRDADHTFTSQSIRTALLELIVGWVEAVPLPASFNQHPSQAFSGDAAFVGELNHRAADDKTA
jgi:pimeloyl-ACP methyl ester carboxylesterase